MDASLPPAPSDPPWGRVLGWVLAIVGPAAAAGLGLLLGPVLQPQVLPPFLLAVAAAAVIGGLGAGLLAVVLSGFAVNYWFFAPDRLGFASQSDLVAQLVFWACALLIAALGAWSRAWRLRAENESGALSAERQSDRAQMARMQLELDRAMLQEGEREREEAERERRVRAQVEREQATVQAAVRDQAAREQAALEELTAGTVLVADDDAETRRLACHALESGRFRWLSACDGTEALELVGRYAFPVELALIEISLPDMTGQALADELRLGHPALTVLYTTSDPVERLIEQGLVRPDDPVLQKPFTTERLLRTVRALTEQSPRAGAADGPESPRGRP